MKFTVPFLMLDVPNTNGRVYTTEAMQRAIANAKPEIFGRVGLDNGLDVDTSKVAVKCSNLRIEHGRCIADVQILDTPHGKQLMLDYQALASRGCEFRPRGTGQVAEDGTVTDYELISIDLVSDPA